MGAISWVWCYFKRPLAEKADFVVGEKGEHGTAPVLLITPSKCVFCPQPGLGSEVINAQPAGEPVLGDGPRAIAPPKTVLISILGSFSNPYAAL